MKLFSRLFGVATLGIAMLTAASPTASAGRMGGPASEIVTVPAYGTAYFEVPFLAGEVGIVSVGGNGITPLEMYIYDGDGNVWRGVGREDRKTASMNVYRAGTFQIEVHNLGPLPNTFIISTN